MASKKLVSSEPQEKRGYLQKWSPAFLVGWQKRFLIVKDRKLKYYKSESPEDLMAPQGVLNFDFFNCEIVDIAEDKT